MPNYRRAYIAGGTVFLTLVTYQRHPLFAKPENVAMLRQAVATVRAESPFEIVGAAVLPDHLHFIWTLPPEDSNYSKRVGRIKVLFTRALKGNELLTEELPLSRGKHREQDVWQRRFWEHTIRDENDLRNCLDYIHYNPVKHGLVSCPHLWQYSSFHKWLRQGHYSNDWGCQCNDKEANIPDFSSLIEQFGE
ncbi:MAG: transposase [Mojavia pulchra JT2-VF2]|jgi:putative transposase|uniref:Transposase n=1 Tax=Mojavia pulchra JT2-VF2 TaxID=287848 RepID=A0A951Q1C4_9NOST|nr:transposase [Mojavia pulchra JT2-VF2]